MPTSTSSTSSTSTSTRAEASGDDGQPGTVYLLHFDTPYKHARHYLGFATDLDRRVRQHRRGLSGARLMEVLREAGIGFTVARTWEGTRNRERRMKARGKGRICPICRAAGKAAAAA